MSRMDALLSGRYLVVAFSDLPMPYQLALVRYLAIEGSDWDDFTMTEAGASDAEVNEALRHEMPQYLEAYGDYHFGIAEIPTKDFQRVVMSDEEVRRDFGDWETYHKWFMGHGAMPSHASTDRWPVLLSSQDDDDVLQDGWQRLHSYVRDGHSTIPAVFYPEKRHLHQVPALLTKH